MSEVPLYGACKKARPRFWPWLSGKSTQHVYRCSPFAGKWENVGARILGVGSCTLRQQASLEFSQRAAPHARHHITTQGPGWGYFESQFQLDLSTFDDISTQKRTNGSKNEHGIPPRRTFCGLRLGYCRPNLKRSCRLNLKRTLTTTGPSG